MQYSLNCQNFRRFGAEIELNTLDGKIKKLNSLKGENPFGIDFIALLIKNCLKKSVEIQAWSYNFNNNYWIVKPDSSCGIEVCTPVLKGWSGLKDLIDVVELFRSKKVSADDRCSFHVHVDISDLNEYQLASVISWYIKCEHIFMDSVPSKRKVNRYCQMLGLTDLFNTDYVIEPTKIIRDISLVKYYTLNTYHFIKGGGFLDNNRKKTIEFRIAENQMCLSGFDVKNWIRLLLHFIDVMKNKDIPKNYTKDDKWTGLLWLDPEDVFDLLFNQPMSEGMTQVRNWFINRILTNAFNSNLPGIWSNDIRKCVYKNFINYLKKINFSGEYKKEIFDLIYDEKYII